MVGVNNCQEVACAPEVDCKFNPDFANTMEPEFGVDAYCKRGAAICKNIENPICVMLRNSKNKVLFFVKKEEMAIFEEMVDIDTKDNVPRTQLILQYYRCHGSKSLIAISVKDRNKSYLLSCKSDKELQFKDGDFPDKVEDKDQNILFLQSRVIGSNKIEFESFFYREHYLASEENSDSDKLVLKKGLDSSDTSTMFTCTICKKQKKKNYKNCEK